MESFEYHLRIHKPYSSCLKRLENRSFFEGIDPGLPEEEEEISFTDRN
jgi:hypothetical protein